MRLLPKLFLLPLPTVLLSSPWCPVAHAQTEATYPIPKEAAAAGGASSAEDEPTEPSSEATLEESAVEPAWPPREPVPKATAPTPKATAPTPKATVPAAAAPNPYGTPPAPPPPVPGNPYGSVAYRPVTPDENPYPSRHPETAPPRATQEETHWSVGGGLVLESRREIAGAWIADFYVRQERITPSLLFERRLSPGVHLMFQPLLNYRKARQRQAEGPAEDAVIEELRAALEAGIRWVLNPGAAVEVGMSHVLAAGFNQLVVEASPNTLLPGANNFEADQLVLGLGNSLIAERQLVPRLWLRMGAGLVGVSYSSTTMVEYMGEEDETTGEVVESEQESSESAFLVGLTPSFAMQLRLTF